MINKYMLAGLIAVFSVTCSAVVTTIPPYLQRTPEAMTRIYQVAISSSFDKPGEITRTFETHAQGAEEARILLFHLVHMAIRAVDEQIVTYHLPWLMRHYIRTPQELRFGLPIIAGAVLEVWAQSVLFPMEKVAGKDPQTIVERVTAAFGSCWKYGKRYVPFAAGFSLAAGAGMNYFDMYFTKVIMKRITEERGKFLNQPSTSPEAQLVAQRAIAVLVKRLKLQNEHELAGLFNDEAFVVAFSSIVFAQMKK